MKIDALCLSGAPLTLENLQTLLTYEYVSVAVEEDVWTRVKAANEALQRYVEEVHTTRDSRSYLYVRC